MMGIILEDCNPAGSTEESLPAADAGKLGERTRLDADAHQLGRGQGGGGVGGVEISLGVDCRLGDWKTAAELEREAVGGVGGGLGKEIARPAERNDMGPMGRMGLMNQLLRDWAGVAD